MKRIKIAKSVILELQDCECENCEHFREVLEEERNRTEQQIKEEVKKVLDEILMQYKPKSYGFDAGFNHAMNLLVKRSEQYIEEGTVDG